MSLATDAPAPAAPAGSEYPEYRLEAVGAEHGGGCGEGAEAEHQSDQDLDQRLSVGARSQHGEGAEQDERYDCSHPGGAEQGGGRPKSAMGWSSPAASSGRSATSRRSERDRAASATTTNTQ